MRISKLKLSVHLCSPIRQGARRTFRTIKQRSGVVKFYANMQPFVSSMADTENSYRNLGTLLTVAGGMSFLSSMLSGFNRRMTIASNLLLFAGVYLILGTRRFIRFMTEQKRLPGAALYGLGFLLVLFKRNVLGGLLELIGTFALFGGFLPRFMNMMQKVPYIGKYFRFALPSFIYRQSEQETELPL